MPTANGEKKFEEHTILIIDGNNLVHRCRHAMKPLSNANKDVTILFGFIKSMMTEMRRYGPSSVIVCWDGGTPAFRKAALPEYKATRHKEEDLTWPAVMAQMNELRDILPTFGVSSVWRKDIEADDLMFHASLMLKGDRKVIVTTDADLIQAVSPSVMIHSPVKDEEITFYNFETATGVPYSRWLMYKTLIGDSSDNVPGVKGVGPKTALTLIGMKNMYTMYDLLTAARHDDITIPTGIREALKDFGYNTYNAVATATFLYDDMAGARRVVLDSMLDWQPCDKKGVAAFFKRNAFVSMIDPDVYSAFANLRSPAEFLREEVLDMKFPVVPPRRTYA